MGKGSCHVGGKKNMMNSLQEQAVKYCQTKISCGDCHDDYIREHLCAALQVAENGGDLFELDHLVDLEEMLGIPVTYRMLSYINSSYSNEYGDEFSDLFELIDIPEEQEKIRKMVLRYLFDSEAP